MEHSQHQSHSLNGFSETREASVSSKNVKVLVPKRSRRKDCSESNFVPCPSNAIRLVDAIKEQERLHPWSVNCDFGVEGLKELDSGSLASGEIPKEGHLGCDSLEDLSNSCAPQSSEGPVRLIDVVNRQKRLYPWLDDSPCPSRFSQGASKQTNSDTSPAGPDIFSALDEELAEQYDWFQQIVSQSSRESNVSKRKKRVTPKKLVAEMTQDLNLSRISEECEDQSSQSPGKISAQCSKCSPPIQDVLCVNELEDDSADVFSSNNSYSSQKSIHHLVSRVNSISRKLDLQEESIKEGCSKKEDKENKNMVERIGSADKTEVDDEACKKKKFHDPKTTRQYMNQKRCERSLKMMLEAQQKKQEIEEKKKRLEKLKAIQDQIRQKVPKKKDDTKPPWNDEIQEEMAPPPSSGQYLLSNLNAPKPYLRPAAKKPVQKTCVGKPSTLANKKSTELKQSNLNDNTSKEVKSGKGNFELNIDEEFFSQIQTQLETITSSVAQLKQSKMKQRSTSLSSPSEVTGGANANTTKDNNLTYPSHINLLDQSKGTSSTFRAYELNQPWADKLSIPPLDMSTGMRRSLDNGDLKYDMASSFSSQKGNAPLYNPSDGACSLTGRSASDSRLDTFHQSLNAANQQLLGRLVSELTLGRTNSKETDARKSFVTVRDRSSHGSNEGLSNEYKSDLPFSSPSKLEKGVQSDMSFCSTSQLNIDSLKLNNINKLSHPGDSLSLNLPNYRSNLESFGGNVNVSFTPSKTPSKDVLNVSIEKGDGDKVTTEKYSYAPCHFSPPEKNNLEMNESTENININVSICSRDSLEPKNSVSKDFLRLGNTSNITVRDCSAIQPSETSYGSIHSQSTFKVPSLPSTSRTHLFVSPRQKSIKSSSFARSLAASSSSTPHLSDSGDSMRGQADNDNSFFDIPRQMFIELYEDEKMRVQNRISVLKKKENALVEHAKSEFAFLKLEKQRLIKRDERDMIPNIKKKQRGLLVRLQQEIREIEAMKKAEKNHFKERKLLLLQHYNMLMSRLSKKTSEREGKSSSPLGGRKTSKTEKVCSESNPGLEGKKSETERKPDESIPIIGPETIELWTKKGRLENDHKSYDSSSTPQHLSRRKIDRGTSPLIFSSEVPLLGVPLSTSSPIPRVEGRHSQASQNKASGSISRFSRIQKPSDYFSDSFDQNSESVHTSGNERGSEKECEPVKSMVTIKVPLSPRVFYGRRRYSSGSDESVQYSQTETQSDQSDLELRVSVLQQQLKQRKSELERLKREHRETQRERLKSKEKSLLSQINAYDTYIEQIKKELQSEIESGCKVVVKPQIKNPKNYERRKSDIGIYNSHGAQDSSIKSDSKVLDKSASASQEIESESSEAGSSRTLESTIKELSLDNSLNSKTILEVEEIVSENVPSNKESTSAILEKKDSSEVATVLSEPVIEKSEVIFSLGKTNTADEVLTDLDNNSEELSVDIRESLHGSLQKTGESVHKDVTELIQTEAEGTFEDVTSASQTYVSESVEGLNIVEAEQSVEDRVETEVEDSIYKPEVEQSEVIETSTREDSLDGVHPLDETVVIKTVDDSNHEEMQLNESLEMLEVIDEIEKEMGSLSVIKDLELDSDDEAFNSSSEVIIKVDVTKKSEIDNEQECGSENCSRREGYREETIMGETHLMGGKFVQNQMWDNGSKCETPLLSALQRERQQSTNVDYLAFHIFESSFEEAFQVCLKTYHQKRMRNEQEKKTSLILSELGISLETLKGLGPEEIKKLYQERSLAAKEAELLRLQQLRIEKEIEELEHAQVLPFYYREIPNKPPPPYSPPMDEPPTPEETVARVQVAVEIMWDAAEKGEDLNSLRPQPDFLPFLKDTSYRKFIFDLGRELYLKFCPPVEPFVPSWKMIGVNKKRKPLIKTKEDLMGVIRKHTRIIFGHEPVVQMDPLILRWSKKRRDFLDELILRESQEEEFDWTDLTYEENIIKNEITEYLIDCALDDAVIGLSHALNKKAEVFAQ